MDEAEAENTLSQISYYHFKIYLHPLLDPASPGGKHYRKDEYFEYGVELYRFDEKLRVLLFGVIARLEVKLRSRLDHTLSAFSNDPFWYLDNTFSIQRKALKLLMTFEVEYKVTLIRKGALREKLQEKYHNNSHPQFSNLPPFWIASEVITIGCLFQDIQCD
nr:Abi family protein [Klebsiella variicola]